MRPAHQMTHVPERLFCRIQLKKHENVLHLHFLSIFVCRILLVAVAILSLYSVHLLLMTAKEGGWC